jgi:hypothetical protein
MICVFNPGFLAEPILVKLVRMGLKVLGPQKKKRRGQEHLRRERDD